MSAPRARKKLIEVALPLDAINAAAAREKSIRHGHPSTLHLWWARRPLAAARAVIFAQMVDDPSAYVDVLLSDPTKKRAAQRALKKRRGESSDRQALADMAAELERERLFRILEKLVLWESTTDEAILKEARTEIGQSWRRACAEHADHPRSAELFDRHTLPAFHDPFAGGGSLALEAQRLGLEAHASDLNPVAVLINKGMIEIPPRFAGRPPVNPEARDEPAVVARTWKGAQGLADDVRHYGRWMRDQAKKRIASVSAGRGHVGNGTGATGPEAVRGPRADGDCVAVGADGEEPEPGVRGCERTACVDVHVVDEAGPGGVRRAGDRRTGVPVRSEGRCPARCGRRESRNQAVARGELPMPDVRLADCWRLHQGRGTGEAIGNPADGVGLESVQIAAPKHVRTSSMSGSAAR